MDVTQTGVFKGQQKWSDTVLERALHKSIKEATFDSVYSDDVFMLTCADLANGIMNVVQSSVLMMLVQDISQTALLNAELDLTVARYPRHVC